MTALSSRRQRVRWVASAMVLLGCPWSVRGADPQAVLSRQLGQQEQARADTEEIVRRTTAILRVLHHQGLDREAKEKFLDDVLTTLTGLDHQQMSAIVRHLNTAAADDRRWTAEVDAAYRQHREIIDALMDLRARCDAVQSLEDAAQRMDAIARKQLEAHLASNHLVGQWQAAKDRKVLATTIVRQGHQQLDLSREVGMLLSQLDALSGKLPEDHAARLTHVCQVAKKGEITDKLSRAAVDMTVTVDGQPRAASLEEAHGLQRRLASALSGLAGLLLKPVDKIDDLRDAREGLANAIATLEQARKEAELPRAEAGRTNAEQDRDQADRVGRVAFDGRCVQNLIAIHVPPLAGKMDSADRDLDAAERAVRVGDRGRALAPEDEALREWREVLKQLDAQIAAAEKQQQQPDLNSALAEVEKALELTEQAKEAAKQAQTVEPPPQNKTAEEPPALPELQKQVAQRAEQLQQPAAVQPAANAAEKLKKGDIKAAIKEQEKTLQKLHEAAQKQPQESRQKSDQKPDKSAETKPAASHKSEAKTEHQPETGAQAHAPQKSAMPKPLEAKDAAELADSQQMILEATKAAQRSQEATGEARAAVAQAEAEVPRAMQPRLDEANKQLADAAKHLDAGSPHRAGQAHGKAADELKEVLDNLKDLAASQPAAKPDSGPSQPALGKSGTEKATAKSKPAKAANKAITKGPEADEAKNLRLSRTASQLTVRPDRRDEFISLPPRQRELIRQAQQENLPPDYAPLIQKYYENVARGKPAVAPSAVPAQKP